MRSMLRTSLLGLLLALAGAAAPATRPATVPGGAPATQRVRPGPDNTGPTDRSKLRVIEGVLECRKDGETIENFDVAGGISIYANNVTLRNFVSRDNVKVFSGTGTLFEDGEVYSPKGNDGISAQDFTARRMKVHTVHDAFRIGDNSTLEGCYVYDYGTAAGHSDGLQAIRPTVNVKIIGNTFVAGNCTSCLNGVNDTWIVQGNWFFGGGYTMYCYSEGRPQVVNNFFGDIKHGIARFWPKTGVWRGNVDIDTGKEIE